MNYQLIIDKYYPEGTPLRDIYLRHCRQVADKALAIANAKKLDTLDREEIEAAAMLHDIGIFLCDAPGIECRGTEHYLRHGLLGADLLRKEGMLAAGSLSAANAQATVGMFERMACVAERHTGSGITREEIIADDLPLPIDRCFLPESKLERLICYADKFFSKSGSMEEKPLGKVMVSMSRFGPEPYARFRALHNEFGRE